MGSPSGTDEICRLLAALNAQAEQANRGLERIEASLAKAPDGQIADEVRQLDARLDRIERLVQEAIGELRAVTLVATSLTRRFEDELDELRAQVTADGEAPEGGSNEEPEGPSGTDD